MENLQVGDSVLTGSGKYSKVYTFGHLQKKTEATFLQIETANQTLEMTGEHLVYLSDKSNPVRADSVKIGDTLRGDAAPAKVTSIGSVTREGLYAPLTLEGSLVVDGIVASGYVSFQKDSPEYVQVNGVNTGLSHHTYAHLGLAPYRLFCENIATGNICNSYDDVGMPGFIRFAVELSNLAVEQNPFVQSLMLILIALVCGLCMLLEGISGASLAPLAVLGGCVIVVMKGETIASKKLKTV